MGPGLRCEGLVRKFGAKCAVDGVGLEVRQGEVVGLLGPNGAGKTTCFGMIAGLVRPHAGRVWIDGTEVTRLPLFRRARMGLGYLAQEPSVFRGLSAEDNLRLVLEAGGATPERIIRRVDGLLGEMGLEDVRATRAVLLSGGERRRLEIARALALSPRYLLLDEPFTGVDPRGVLELRTWIGKLAARGIGVLMTDHNVRDCLAICDSACLLHEGRVIVRGTPEQVASDATVRRVYLGDDFRS